ncbi:hypothetical protein [Halalkalicoccus sp. NIPERK01]|uniref:hypothetical protein n=1 Tax=Halalkalicoccus sp. NIPERK01 TaxID=3053469 RepID=UPI00256EE857|nr:hypothetical protein [Halalkalicoccus sp. NIPERK01]MDL5363158.1 hypothetical protein [Halalkalicoccus sp. NIPERK01]
MSGHSTSGRKPRVTDDEVLAVFRRTDDPVLSTVDVADELPIKRRATLTRLQRLADSGSLKRKEAGGRNTVWWLADDERLRGGSAEPLREVVGLVDKDGAQRVKERSKAFREAFSDRMDRRRDARTERETSGESE